MGETVKGMYDEELCLDCGGRRSGIDRRQFSYAIHIPERRSGDERRNGSDRRSGEERRSSDSFRTVVEEDRRRWFRSHRIWKALSRTASWCIP
jgi:hypothetical protein